MNLHRPGRIWIPEASNLILDRGPCPRRTIELGLQSNMRLEGWFDVKLIEAATGRVKRHLHFKNLITNAGLDAMETITPSNIGRFFSVGTGATAPAATDTTLLAQTGGRIAQAGITLAAGPANAYYSCTYTGLFLEATANGNLTEVGLFSAAVAGTMWSRQLFKDGTGVPTVLVKTAADQLQITYEMRIYPPTVDVTGSVIISTISYAYVNRAANITSSLTWGNSPFLNWNSSASSLPSAYETDVLGTTSGQPGGTSGGASSVTSAAYVVTSYQRDRTIIWEPPAGNFPSGIGALSYGAPNNYGAPEPFQVNFTPKIPKTSVKRLTLVARINWARYP